MNTHALSSGDLIADRRAEYARMLAESGDFLSAADLMGQALEMAPNWAAGWFLAGEYWQKGNNRPEAANAFRKVLANSEDDIFGAVLKLSLLGELDVPDQPPVSYVEQLFDDYADRFEDALLGKLHYRVPEKLAELVQARAGEQFACTVDLGCGTGLFGARVREHTRRLEGFDLSANMLAKAEEKGLYDYLSQADLSLGADEERLFTDGLQPGRADLLAAADVVMYLGDLEPLFQLARKIMHPLGHFAFSAELALTGDDFTLLPSMRYAHSPAYIEALAVRYGFRPVVTEKLDIRWDAGAPVKGILFLSQNMANA
ncbi:methyltransferase [Rhizobium sp. L1K21]|uniref:methyltransferase n=1 Tax=Rhizobium sp. L1K21 TaxID=2954933 RepID=UPI002092FBD4|nr:methyltransferase [Rhizobium sp. L1K21]MCO6187174.1 methyltransferase domain-containing protein [Rhizobium sp. L1K21]